MDYNTNYNPKTAIEDLIFHDAKKEIFYRNIYPAILKKCKIGKDEIDGQKLFNCLDEVKSLLYEGRSLETIEYIVKHPIKALNSINSRANLPFPKSLKGNRVPLEEIEGNNSDYESAVYEGRLELGVKIMETY